MVTPTSTGSSENLALLLLLGALKLVPGYIKLKRTMIYMTYSFCIGNATLRAMVRGARVTKVSIVSALNFIGSSIR